MENPTIFLNYGALYEGYRTNALVQINLDIDDKSMPRYEEKMKL
jgi:hypothetical protein